MHIRIRSMSVATPAAILLLAFASATDAHHSVAMFDTNTPVTITGKLIGSAFANPHSFLYVEQQTGQGTIVWAVEGPAPSAMFRRGARPDMFAEGDAIEACGYLLKEGGQQPSAGRTLLVAEVLVLPNGEATLWSPYGNTHCQDQGVYEIRQ